MAIQPLVNGDGCVDKIKSVDNHDDFDDDDDDDDFTFFVNHYKDFVEQADHTDNDVHTPYYTDVPDDLKPHALRTKLKYESPVTQTQININSILQCVTDSSLARWTQQRDMGLKMPSSVMLSQNIFCMSTRIHRVLLTAKKTYFILHVLGRSIKLFVWMPWYEFRTVSVNVPRKIKNLLPTHPPLPSISPANCRWGVENPICWWNVCRQNTFSIPPLPYKALVRKMSIIGRKITSNVWKLSFFCKVLDKTVIELFACEHLSIPSDISPSTFGLLAIKYLKVSMKELKFKLQSKEKLRKSAAHRKKY